MQLTIRSDSRIHHILGSDGVEFLRFAMAAVERILPHVEVTNLRASRAASGVKTHASWDGNNRKGIKLTVALPGTPQAANNYVVTGVVKRRKLPAGVGSVERTLDLRERAICDQVMDRISQVLGPECASGRQSLSAIRATFDEQVIAAHIQAHHKLGLNPADLLSALRGLAEQSYENKPITFGCLIDVKSSKQPPKNAVFPRDYLLLKRFRLLSDGYRTCYKVSSHGCLLSFVDIEANKKSVTPGSYYPEWCEYFAKASQETVLGLLLTRQGDVLVFDRGTLRFSYRLGLWRYWNHGHLIDLLRNAARAQRVPPKKIPPVVRALHRSALDVSFRRTGGLFVVLRNQRRVRALVRKGDAISDKDRSRLDGLFDKALPSTSILTMSRRTVAELAAVDGAIILNKKGELVAYGAVLEPKQKGTIHRAEGSRTKAAIGSSNYGIAVKISSDGDISIYIKGKRFVQV